MTVTLNEDFFKGKKDNIQIKKTRKTVDDYILDNKFSIVFGVLNCPEKNETDCTVPSEYNKTIENKLVKFCNNIDIFNDFAVRIFNDRQKYLFTFGVTIEFSLAQNTSYKHYSNAIHSLINIVMNLLHNLKYTFMGSDVKLYINDDNTYMYDLTESFFIKSFKDCSEDDFENTKYDYHWNGFKTLSVKSTKRIEKANPGDILYATRNDELVLDKETDGKKNKPIAIYVSNNKFVALNYLAWHNPTHGTKEYAPIAFGNMKGDAELRHKLKKEHNLLNLTSGIHTTECLYDYLNHTKPAEKALDIANPKYVYTKDGVGEMPLLECCYAYRTAGTKPGDWYIPCTLELILLFGNHEYIDDTRKELGYEELHEVDFWSSEETGVDFALTVDMGHGSRDKYHYKSYYKETLGIAFIEIKDIPQIS